MSEIQLLRDPDVEPISEVIAEALGVVNDVYITFIKSLKDYDIDLEWRYYTDGKSWLAKGVYKWTGVRGGQKQITTFWLSIWDGFFKITFYIPEKSRAEALSLSLDEKIKSLIADSKQIGKLKFFPIVFDLRSDEILGVIYELINFRKVIK